MPSTIPILRPQKYTPDQLRKLSAWLMSPDGPMPVALENGDLGQSMAEELLNGKAREAVARQLLDKIYSLVYDFRRMVEGLALSEDQLTRFRTLERGVRSFEEDINRSLVFTHLPQSNSLTQFNLEPEQRDLPFDQRPAPQRELHWGFHMPDMVCLDRSDLETLYSDVIGEDLDEDTTDDTALETLENYGRRSASRMLNLVTTYNNLFPRTSTPDIAF